MNILALVLWPLCAFADADLTAVERKFTTPPRYGDAPPTTALRHEPPQKLVSFDDILTSPVVQKALRSRATVQDIASGKTEATLRDALVEVHTLTDEHEFFYLVDSDGKTTRRVAAKFVTEIAAVSEMYEPPRQFTPVVSLRNVSPHDRPFARVVDVSMAAGQTNAGWTGDLLESKRARRAYFTRPGVSVMGDWPTSLRLGATFQYEASAHRTAWGTANYQNPSIGVVAKTRRLETFASRFGLQFRWGPAAKLEVPSAAGVSSVDLRVSSLQLSWERTDVNRFGEWAWGILWQREWVKLREQKQYTSLAPRSRTNDQLGLFIAQGFPW